jgi:hypothetical protein
MRTIASSTRLIQDAAYENLLKSRRQILHRRIAETLRERAAAGGGTEPELMAHHFTQAGLTEDAVEWWGKAGQRSLERSALLEAVAKFTRGLDQIATLPSTPTLRSQQIKLQVGLANTLYHTKGFSAVETKAAFDQARAMIERAEDSSAETTRSGVALSPVRLPRISPTHLSMTCKFVTTWPFWLTTKPLPDLSTTFGVDGDDLSAGAAMVFSGAGGAADFLASATKSTFAAARPPALTR